MGSSESKIAASAAIKPEPAINKGRVSQLMDPRSPSNGIDRTPIQVDGLVSKTSAEVKSECLPAFSDPRSPSIGITRTPVREVMRVTVGSFAHRISMLFHSEAEDKAPEDPQKRFNYIVGEELASTDPLLTPQLSNNCDSLAEHANLLDTPVLPPLPSIGDSSPFVLLEGPQVEVEIETEAEIDLEEVKDARESPLHKRLSMSLITYHEGATSSHIFAEVHCDGASSPEPSVGVEPLKDGVDHSYALPSIPVEPESPVEPSPAQGSPAQPEEAEKLPPSEETRVLVKESSLPSVCSPPEPPTVPSPEQPQVCPGIRCPTFDLKSPSQAVFKPQWLGKGFGATGLRARGVQGHSRKGGSSPLAVRVVVKNVTSENKGQSGKRKQKDEAEGLHPRQAEAWTDGPPSAGSVSG